MSKILYDQCLNCSAAINQNYCSNCGQRTDVINNKSVIEIVTQTISNFSFVDNRILRTLWFLLFKPGQMTVRYINGERKKFLNPVNVFLFVNVLFFLTSPIKDYYLNLNDQISSQYYSEYSLELIKYRIAEDNIDYSIYANRYDDATPKLSKVFILLNIPIIAFWLFPLIRRKRKYFYDSLILAFHFFSLFLLFSIILNLVGSFVSQYFDDTGDTIYKLIMFLLLIFHCSVCMKNYMRYNIISSIGMGLYLLMGALIALGFYRGLIFLITYLFLL